MPSPAKFAAAFKHHWRPFVNAVLQNTAHRLIHQLLTVGTWSMLYSGTSGRPYVFDNAVHLRLIAHQTSSDVRMLLLFAHLFSDDFSATRPFRRTRQHITSITALPLW